MIVLFPLYALEREIARFAQPMRDKTLALPTVVEGGRCAWCGGEQYRYPHQCPALESAFAYALARGLCMAHEVAAALGFSAAMALWETMPSDVRLHAYATLLRRPDLEPETRPVVEVEVSP